MFRFLTLSAVVVSALPEEWNDLGSHAGFPVERVQPGGVSYTYMSVPDPGALNLDGSRYGIAVCLSTVSKANWTCKFRREPPCAPKQRPP